MSNAAFIATSAATTAAAAAHAAKMRDEEENMTGYNKEDLDGWEFKIVRSTLGRFSNYEKVQEVCRQEAKAGWELVEKFDQYRLRFKRRTDMRSKDQFLDTDPYRTNIGGGGKLAGIIIGVIALAIGVIAFLVLYLRGQHIRIEPTGIIMIIIAVGVLVLLITLIASRVGKSSRPKGPKINY